MNDNDRLLPPREWPHTPDALDVLLRSSLRARPDARPAIDLAAQAIARAQAHVAVAEALRRRAARRQRTFDLLALAAVVLITVVLWSGYRQISSAVATAMGTTSTSSAVTATSTSTDSGDSTDSSSTSLTQPLAVTGVLLAIVVAFALWRALSADEPTTEFAPTALFV